MYGVEVKEMSPRFGQWFMEISKRYKNQAKFRSEQLSGSNVLRAKLPTGRDELLIGVWNFSENKGKVFDRRREQMVVHVDRRGW